MCLSAGLLASIACSGARTDEIRSSLRDASIDAESELDASMPEDPLDARGDESDGGEPEAGADSGAPDTLDAVPDAEEAVQADTGAAVDDVFVNPTNGVDSNVGSKASPFKTLYQAVAKVPSGRTIWLEDGMYDQASQGSRGAIALPDGVSARAVNSGLAVLDTLQVTADGASTLLDGLVFQNGAALSATNSTARTPTLTLNQLKFVAGSATNANLTVGGKTQAVLNAPSFSGPMRSGIITALASAQIVVKGGSIDAGGAGASGFGAGLISLQATSQLSLEGVTMSNSNTPGISINGNTKATPVRVRLSQGTLLDAVGNTGNCAASAAIIATQNADIVLDGATIKNAPGAGICVRNAALNSVNVTLQNGAILDNDGQGIASETGTGSNATIVVQDSTLRGNVSAAVHWEGGGSLEIARSTLTGNGVGLYLAPFDVALAVKLRASALSNNTMFGVRVIELSTALTLDLGTSADPGSNTLTGNGQTSLTLTQPAATRVSAVGNTWNAGTEGADADGHYPAGTDVTGPTSSGSNYQMLNATVLHL